MTHAAAGVLFTRGTQVLLVQNSYKTDWNLPGGILDPGETARQAAARELKEELGIIHSPGRLLVVDNVILRTGELLTVYVFNGGRINTNRIHIDGQEIVAWQWCDPKQLAAKTATAPIFRARVRAAIIAAGPGGRVRYLESGAIDVHGTRARYVKGCRCQPCTKANTVYGRDRRLLAKPHLRR